MFARLTASLAAVLLVLLIGGPARAQNGPEPVLATDLMKIRQLGHVTLSPDGRQVLYTVTSIEDTSGSGKAYAYQTHLYAVDIGGSLPARQLTRGDRGAREPAWHPDGDRIAFVRSVDGKPQVFVLPLLGGEAYQVTYYEHGASSPEWSPDGSKILFASNLKQGDLRSLSGRTPEWDIERPGRAHGDSDDVEPDPNGSLPEVRAWLDANSESGNPRVIDRLNFLGEMDLEAAPSFRHVFVQEVDSVGAEPVLVTRGFVDFTGAAWIDDNRIVVSGTARSDVHPDHVLDRDLYVADVRGGGFRRFLDLEGYSVFAPVVSPDRQAIAFLAQNLDHSGFSESDLGVVPVADAGGAQLLTLDFDRSVSRPRWSEDSWYLYFAAPSNGGIPLYRIRRFIDREPAVSADTSAADTSTVALEEGELPLMPAAPMHVVEQLTSFERGIQSFDIGRATILYVATEVTNPFELYASNLSFTDETRLTYHNAEWIAAKRLSVPERRVLVRDGFEIDYWVMRPAFFDETRKYPLLVQMHGGPSAMWGPGEATMWHEFQFFASKGYGIVFSNPRGSGGYGYEFRRANFQDWGAGPAGDVLASAEQAAALPWIDPDRQVLTGGSYAGYLTAWIVAHDDRFKAAVAQRGVYDLGTFLGEGNAWRLVPTHFGGYPWDRGDTLDAALETAPDVWADSARTALPADSALAALPADSALAALPADSALAALPADSALLATADPTVSPEDSLATPAQVSRQEIDVAEILIRNSPLTYVDRITTPLLIIHSDQDLRTGVAQSEVLYKSLKILGRPVEYVRYGKSGHDLSRTGDPNLRLDRILRIYEFMERFVR